MIFAGMIRRMAGKADVPAALHLDHGNSFELAEYGIAEGFSSVMTDGLLLPFEENIALSHRVVEMADGIPVETELDTVGGKAFDSKKYLEAARAAVEERVCELIRVCGQ